MQNVDVKLSDLPIAYRFAAWNIAHQTDHGYREMLRGLADCRILRVCPCECETTHCASFYITVPEGTNLPTSDWLCDLHTNKGSVYLRFDPQWIEVEALMYEQFPHREEIHQTLSDGHAPIATATARQARKALRDWLSGMVDRPMITLEVGE